MTDLAWLGIAESAALIRAGKLSPVELTKALLARIEKLDPKWHAFIRITPEIALDAVKDPEKSDARRNGIQYSRIRRPIGVPGPTRTRVSLSSCESTRALHWLNLRPF